MNNLNSFISSPTNLLSPSSVKMRSEQSKNANISAGVDHNSESQGINLLHSSLPSTDVKPPSPVSNNLFADNIFNMALLYSAQINQHTVDNSSPPNYLQECPTQFDLLKLIQNQQQQTNNTLNNQFAAQFQNYYATMLSLNLMNPCNNLGSVFNNALFNPLSQPTNTAPTNDLNLEELTRLIGMNSPPTTETNTNLIPFPMNLLPQLAANLNQFPGMGNVPSLPSNNTLFRDALLLAKQQKGIAISPPVHKNTYHSKNGHNGENGNHNEAIVPSDDNEGWCRNKKYIQRVDNGYMCIVCKKVYGRYNSVSYHVTIYHRNPPIQCTEEGCAFSTREARYIHFHKYYRHGIALPQTIDLESRKCPFCRHVSKSPAMLEKHISRHVPEGSKNVKKPKCPKCNVVCESQMALFQHIKTHEQTDKFQCLVCSSTFATNDDLDKHKVSVHGLAVDGASLSEESGSALSPTSTSDDEPYHRDCTPSSTHTTSPF